MKAVIRTIQTEDFTMDYCRFGQGDRAFVILPGLSVTSILKSADAIERDYAEIAEHSTVYVFDRRKDMPPVYKVEDMARDTARAMEEIGLHEADIFGASQGGMMAMVIAVEYPHLVHKLVLGSTAARAGEMAEQVGTEWGELALAEDRVGLYMAFGDKLFAPETFEKLKATLAKAAEAVEQKDLKRFVILLKGTLGFDVLDQLAQIRCPVLVIGDETDAVLGAQASRDIAAALKARKSGRTELLMYDGWGHAAYDTAPDYKERILQFLLSED